MADEAAKLVEAAWSTVPESIKLGSIVLEAFDLLVDAAAAFDAGACFSASVAIRSAIESGAYLFLTRVRFEEGYRIVRPVDMAGRLRRPDLEEIKRALVARDSLSPTLMLALDRIQEHGNYVAHISSKRDAKVAARTSENLARMRRGLGPLGPLALDPFPTEVFSDLKDGVEIVLALAAKKASEIG